MKSLIRLIFTLIATTLLGISQFVWAQSMAQSFREHQLMCNTGNAGACTNLGVFYQDGFGVRQDKSKAVELFKKACAGGDTIGCYNLGVMYSKGEGVRQDKFKAVELYTKVCAVGNPIGCYNLGLMYINGEGVRLDKKKALEFFGKACDLKYEDSCNYYAALKKEGVR